MALERGGVRVSVVSANAGQWWRASRYAEISGSGNSLWIAPIPAATFTDVQAFDDADGLLDGAWQLLDIVDRLTKRANDDAHATASEQLLPWVQRHGLLGVGMVGLSRIDTAPRTHDVDGVVQAAQVSHVLDIDAAWTTIVEQERGGPFRPTAGVVVDVGDYVGTRPWQPPTARFDTIDGQRDVPLSGALKPFLVRRSRSIAAEWQCPCPTSTEWWQCYGEPPLAMLYGATLQDSAGDLVNLPGALTLREMRDGLASDDDDRQAWAYRFAAALMSHSRVVAGVGGTAIVLPTLLAMLARALFDDAQGDVRLRRCETCNVLFRARRKDAVACSRRCGNTLRQRRRRDNPDAQTRAVLDAWKKTKGVAPADKRKAAAARLAGLGTRTDVVDKVLKREGYDKVKPTR